MFPLHEFLADCTNGRAYATVLRPSVAVCVSVTLCIVAKRCVLEQKLLLRAYRKSYMQKSIGTKMNDLDLCLEGVQTVGRKNQLGERRLGELFFLGDRRLGDNSHFRKDVSPKHGWATKA